VRETLFSPPAIDADKLGCPILVIGASEDKIVPPPMAKKIAQALRAEYREIQGSHLVLKGKFREEMCQTIISWLWNV
jgi:esterase/lipase